MSEVSAVAALKKSILQAIPNNPAIPVNPFAETDLNSRLADFAQAIREPLEKRITDLEKELRKTNSVVNDLHRELKQKNLVR